MNSDIASQYIRQNFGLSDRLAIVLLNKRTGAVTQRVATAERIASAEFQAWLRHMNAAKNEVYVSMNVLREAGHGRTKSDIESIRHLYLDFDVNGTESVQKLLARKDLPPPNIRISSSPGKWQVLWKVEGFAPQRAEELQRFLARETGADPAATDCARVLRLPGFFNQKYAKPHWVYAETSHHRIFRPEDFPKPVRESSGIASARVVRISTRSGHSQSERDWAYAKRALGRGEPEHLVIAAIAVHRRYSKPNPQYYAELTVKKAAEALAREAVHSERQLNLENTSRCR